MEFQFYLPVRVVAGPQAVRRCGPRFAALGKKCLIVTGRHAAAACGALGDVTEALRENGVSWELFDEVGENPLLSDCVRAAALCRACGASFVVGIGGGSPMDAAKAIALLAANPQITGDDLYTAADRHPALPIALVGTTSGTGSEVSAAAVLTDSTGRKKSVKGDDLYAAFAAADAKYTFTLSRAATISTGLDALCHAMEGYLSPKCDPISAGFAELCLPDLWNNLLALWQGEALTEARHRALYGASIQAGFVLNTVGTSFPHPLGYVLTERFGVPHAAEHYYLTAAHAEHALEPLVYQRLGNVEVGGYGLLRYGRRIVLLNVVHGAHYRARAYHGAVSAAGSVQAHRPVFVGGHALVALEQPVERGLGGEA